MTQLAMLVAGFFAGFQLIEFVVWQNRRISSIISLSAPDMEWKRGVGNAIVMSIGAVAAAFMYHQL